MSFLDNIHGEFDEKPAPRSTDPVPTPPISGQSIIGPPYRTDSGVPLVGVHSFNPFLTPEHPASLLSVQTALERVEAKLDMILQSLHVQK